MVVWKSLLLFAASLPTSPLFHHLVIVTIYLYLYCYLVISVSHPLLLPGLFHPLVFYLLFGHSRHQLIVFALALISVLLGLIAIVVICDRPPSLALVLQHAIRWL